MANEATRVAEASVESSDAGVEWPAIWAGALGAVGISFILISLGPALGLTTVSSWSIAATPPVEFGIAAGIWLIITQWLASGLGGYLAGRLRKKWVGIRTDEVFFRDTAHGFLAWALATLIVVGFVAASSAVAASTGTPSAPELTEEARRAAVAFSFYTALSYLIGAFIGSVAGALGGYHRDEV